ncbi:MAG: hypothetical protein JXA33_19035 [Anaerolineae bacterium]|nr:hypothetical protein [Anaerolineae bacterium]
MNSSRLSVFCDRALEAGWLIGVTITPVFFNVYSSRVFEPDKLTTLRSLAVVMAILWLVRFMEEVFNDKKPLRFSWRTPMVLPALLTMGIYVISSIFSLVPFTSFIGSYQRLQGTYTLFGYLVLFFALLTSLRTREQLSRLITVLILNSLPISLYGIIQHNGLDPLPWAGDVQTRVASNMGNAIFVAAYLIMLVPLTAARIVESFNDILSRAEARISDILRASGYIFLLAVQVITIWYSQSRGPWLGIVAAGFVFPYLGFLLLQKRALVEDTTPVSPLNDILKGLGVGVGALVLAGAFVGLSILAIEGKAAIYVGGALGALVFGGVWLYMIVERKGWRWLWIGWGTVGLTIALSLVAINVPGPLQDQVLKISSIRRLATITQLESGTGKVRTLIWEGAVELISFHDPIKFPDGNQDKLNAVRFLIGYGPESMYVAYNSFYPPELGHYESRTASPDRSHNETLDSVVITGVLGLAVYLFTFGSVFYWGFKWLGLLNTRRQFLLWLALDATFAVLLFVVGLRLDGLHLFAVAIPLGAMVGTMLYVTLQAISSLFKGTHDEVIVGGENPHTILIIAILAAVLAHFVEINFGIAIASTRTTFWTYAAMLVTLGLQWIPAGNVPVVFAQEENEMNVISGDSPVRESSSRHRKARTSKPQRAPSKTMGIQPWFIAVIVLTLSAIFLLGTLAFDFINNSQRLSSAGDIFVRSLTMKYQPKETKSYGALMIFLFTWVLFGVIGLSELDREGLFDKDRAKRWGISLLTYASLAFVGLLIFGGVIAGLQARLTQVQVQTIEDVVGVANQLASLLARYYGLIFILLILIAWSLMYEWHLPRIWGNPISLGALLILLLLGTWAIRKTNYDLIRSDIIYKQGGVFANNNNSSDKQIGIAHYEKCLEYTPREDYYNLFLGKAYLELAQGLPEDITSEQREFVFNKTEEVLKHARELNPLNTDHSANLARFYKSWAARITTVDLRKADLSDAQKTALKQQRDDLLQLSLESYETALVLSPNNPIIWNELALLYSVDLGDMPKATEVISHSLEVDVGFEQTWQIIGDLRSTEGDLVGAVKAYQESLELAENCTVRRAVGTLQAQQELWSESIETLLVATEKCSKSSDLWDYYRVLAIAYANQGNFGAALDAANTALDRAPDAQKSAVEQLLQTLEAQIASLESTPQP